MQARRCANAFACPCCHQASCTQTRLPSDDSIHTVQVRGRLLHPLQCVMRPRPCRSTERAGKQVSKRLLLHMLSLDNCTQTRLVSEDSINTVQVKSPAAPALYSVR